MNPDVTWRLGAYPDAGLAACAGTRTDSDSADRPEPPGNTEESGARPAAGRFDTPSAAAYKGGR